MHETDKDRLRECLKFTSSLKHAMEETTLRVEGSDNIWQYTGYKQFARKYMSILDYIADVISLPPFLDFYNMEKIPSLGDTLPDMRKEIFESVYANLSLLQSFLETQLDTIDDEILSLRDFLQSRLRSAVFEIPENEKSIQNIIDQLFVGRGMQKGQDYGREVGRVKIASKESVPDFVFFRLSLAVEVKLVKNADRVKRVIDEISADIMSYSKKYRHQLYVIYDLGHIRDQVEFCHDFEKTQSVSLIIIKH
ncbi:MAG: hypothetical protein OXF76_03860 [Caldilineaceae bacterium]|nr:hypothetical protein [Caldilineaceae bacterium]